jgi:small-conductance mechanosensitive channel/CRP-like cAMP-binding protein
MLTDWAMPLVYGLGVLLALELVFLLLRRTLPGFRLRFLYHLWAVSLGLVTALAVGAPGSDGLAWKAAATTALLLSAVVGFALVEAVVIQRPWRPAPAPLLPKLARDVLRMGLLITVGLLAAKVILRQPLGAIIVSSTVVSAVAGLALQDVLKNVFAGMALDLEKPFARGDWLLLDGTTPAQVIDLTWRSTRLRTNEGVEISEPNATISNARLINYGSGVRPVALGFTVGLTYGAPPAEVKRALRAAAGTVPGTLAEPPIEVFTTRFDDHAVTYYMRVWTRNVGSIARFRDGVNTRIWYELKRRGLTIPFPIRTVHVHSAEQMAAAERSRDRDRAAGLLGQLELFREIDPEAVASLAEGAALREYDAGELLVREGETGESLLVIESGSAVVSKQAEGHAGVEVDVGRLGAGDFFGERSLLTGEARSATVRADGGCVVLEISKRQLGELLARDPKIAEVLSRALAARRDLTAASLESHQDRLRKKAEPQSEVSILHRIRTFFRLT